jgi:hypothetical protein
MRDIDPQLMRLREVEARIVLVEFHLREQEDLVRRLKARELDGTPAADLLQSLRVTLGVFRQRQQGILEAMRAAPEPLPAQAQPPCQELVGFNRSA